MFAGSDTVPERHDLTLFPTVNDLKNHLHQALKDIENGSLGVTASTVSLVLLHLKAVWWISLLNKVLSRWLPKCLLLISFPTASWWPVNINLWKFQFMIVVDDKQLAMESWSLMLSVSLALLLLTWILCTVQMNMEILPWHCQHCCRSNTLLSLLRPSSRFACSMVISKLFHRHV